MNERTARRIRKLDGYTGRAFLYAVSPPIEAEVYDWKAEKYITSHFDHVVVSATYAPFSGPETYIFGADKDGNVLNWGELDGSYRGGLDHAAALADAGYAEIVDGTEVTA